MSTVDNDRAELTELLAAARKAKGLSVRAAARAAGVPAATAQGWLSGRHLPTPALRDNFRQLLTALDLEIPDALWIRDAEPLTIPIDSGRPPYLGLRPFAIEDADLFFGRTREARRLAEMIVGQPGQRGLIALVGGSGSGKSSLLAAGLLGRECVDGTLAGWTTQTFDAQTLAPATNAELVLIDQFEEVLQLEPEARAGAMAAIQALADQCVVVIGLRSDWFGVAAEHYVLAPALARPMLLTPMDREELAQAIVVPAQRAGITVEPELVSLLLTDLAADTAGDQTAAHSSLPLLSSVLLMIWAVADSGRMTAADYQRTGGLASAVENLAEGVFAELSADQKSLAAHLFLRLVRLTESGVARTRVALADLSADERSLSEQFITARLLAVTGEKLSISHDALLAHWRRLGSWIDAGRVQLRVREQLRRATSIWLDNGRSPDSLLPVNRLPMFSEFVAQPGNAESLSADEQEFLDRSEQHFASQLDVERATSAKLRRRQRLIIVLAVLATVTALIAVLTSVNTRRVQLQAQSRQVAYSVRSNTSGDLFLEAQMALAANDLANTVEARSVLLDTFAGDVPTRWTGQAPAVLAMAPDQSIVIRADAKGGLTRWQSADLFSSPGESWATNDDAEPLYAAAIAQRDARMLAAVGGAGQGSVWDVTGQPQRLSDLAVGEETVFAVAFDTDDETLVLGDSLGRLRAIEISDPARPRAVAEVEAGASVTSIAVDPTGSGLYVGGVTGEIRRWQFAEGELVEQPPLPYDIEGRTPRAQSVAVSPDGRWLVAGLGARASVRWDLKAPMRPPVVSTDYASWVNSVRFVDADTYLTADSGQHVRVVDAATDRVERVLSGPALMTGAEIVNGHPVAVDTAGTLLAWPAQSPTLRLSGQPVYQFAGDAAGTRWLAHADLGTNTVELWSLAHGVHKSHSLAVPDDLTLYSSITMDAAGTMLWAGSTDGRVVAWQLDGPEISEPRVHRVADESVVFNNVVVDPAGRLLVVTEYLKEHSRLYRIEPDGTLTELAVLDTLSPQIARFSADSALLTIGIARNEVRVWSLADPFRPEELPAIATDSNPSASNMSPSGRLLGIGTDLGTVSVWDLSSPDDPQLVREYHQSQAAIYGVNFSPDGRRVASAGGDEVFYVWNLADDADAAELVLDGEMGRTTDLIFLGDTAQLIGAGNNGAARIWDLDLDRVELQLCARRGTPLSDQEWRRAIVGVDPFDPCA